jgi:hypothetical protein
MINERRASLGILSSVEAIQFCCDEVQCLVSVEELGQQRRVISLEDTKLAVLYNTLQHPVHLSLISVQHYQFKLPHNIQHSHVSVPDNQMAHK